jgi:TRAP-type C4-dicarboxylate transport system substrate-binding protein
VVMTRQKFDGLPEQARQTFRKLSGGWTAERYIQTYRAENDAAVESLKRDSNRNVVVPSPKDLARAHAVFRAEVDTWSATDPRHQELLAKAEAELKTISDGPVGER